MTRIPFDEADWLRQQRGLALRLQHETRDWMDRQPLHAPFRERLKQIVLSGEEEDRTDSPALFGLRMSLSLGVPEARVWPTAVACTLFWAAADLADDIDDATPREGSSDPTVNDVCALLFLTHRAFAEVSPTALQLAMESGLVMSAGQALDLASTDFPQEPDVDSIIKKKAGAEFGLFFHLAAHLANTAPDSTTAIVRLGEQLGTVLQILSDVIDLYVNPVSEDFAAGKWSLPLALYLRGQGDSARRFYAYRRDRRDVMRAVRYEARDSAEASIQSALASLEECWKTVSPLCHDPGPTGQLVEWVQSLARALNEGLAEMEPAAPVAPTSLAASRDRACRYLMETPESAEEHRWGLFGKPLVRGQLYTEIFRHAGLRCLGESETCADTLLSLRDADGWHYFPHESQIPADADDAGLILGHFGDLLPAAIVEQTCAQLTRHFTEDGIHTWMDDQGTLVDWEGDDCQATIANAVWGLVCTGLGRHVPSGVWDRLLAVATTRQPLESAFYGDSLTRFFMHRAIAAGCREGLLSPSAGTEARQSLANALNAEERLGGNFGSLLDTLAATLAAAEWQIPIPAALAATWIIERQEADGSWPCPPLFRGVGVNYQVARWGHPLITTGLALLALQSLDPDEQAEGRRTSPERIPGNA